MRKFKIHSIRYNFIMNFILKVSMVLFPLITTPYMLAVIGVEGYGRINFATSLIAYITTFSSLGMSIYGVKVCALYRNDREALSKTVQELMIISAVMVTAAYAALAALILFVPKLYNNRDMLIVCSLSIFLANMGMEWLYQALEQYDYITWRNILFNVVSLVLLFVFVKTEKDILLCTAITVLGTFGANIFNMIKSRDHVSWTRMSGYNFKKHFRPIVSFFSLTVATTVYNNLNVIMLGFMQNDLEVGYYSVARKVKSILVCVVTAIGTVLFPRINSIIADDRKELFHRIIKKSYEVVMLFAVYSVLFFVIEADETVYLLAAGETGRNAVLCMQIVIPTVVLIGLSNITGIQILVPLGKEKWTVLSTVIGAAVNLILNFLLIPKYGSVAVSAGTLVTEAVVLLVQLPAVRKEIDFGGQGKDTVKILLAGACAAGVLIFARMRTAGVMGLWSFFWRGCLYTGLYGLVLCLTRESFVTEQLIKIKEFAMRMGRGRK